ncbi:hypothetical protein F0L17_02660 [Streptomyces sp. TRM43335]|uniref:DUF3618 domain-containing protein n=1 Tax=Streptomyces taklimakanensis TaxID=2569853 RepID=A0A6G2B706_9ACTN|nr:hypothetical protein [Streptomyces taklimakanensis]MTE18048.1 hypothetical protein [Streptomyces taklimakanensis]
MSEAPNTGHSPGGQTGQAAKQETRATADRAKDAAGTVAGSAREQARHVTGDAREQVVNMAGHLKERASKEADTQTRRTADTIRQWADDLAGMAESARSDSPVRNLASQAADSSRRAADLLEEKGAGGLVGEVESFARRRPGAFLAGAALAGFALGRAAKAGKAAHHGPDGRSGEHARPAPSPDLPVTTGGGEVRQMPDRGEPPYGGTAPGTGTGTGAYGTTGTYGGGTTPGPYPGTDTPRRPEVG